MEKKQVEHIGSKESGSKDAPTEKVANKTYYAEAENPASNANWSCTWYPDKGQCQPY